MGSKLELMFISKEKSQIIDSPVIRGITCEALPVSSRDRP